MWRSIASRSSLTSHLGEKLLSFHHPLSSLSSSHILHKTLNPSSNFRHPTKTPHQNYRFVSHCSSIDDSETDAHDVTSSCEELELENGGGLGFSVETHDVSSSQELELTHDFDETSAINVARLSSFDSINRGFEGIKGGGFCDVTHDVTSSQKLELTPDIGEISENSYAHISSFSSNAQDLEGTNVEKMEILLSLLQNSLDESLESKFDTIDLRFTEEFLVKVIKTPLVSSDHLIRFFKWVLSKNKFTLTPSILGSLTQVICNNPKGKDTYALWDLMKNIGVKQKGVVNSETLNRLISAFSILGKGKTAFEVFSKFQELECIPNSDTYFLTIESLCKRFFYNRAMSVCQDMLNAGKLPEGEKLGEIISLFCKGRRSKEAHVVFLAAKQHNVKPPQKSINFLIGCLSKVDETVYFAQEMLVDFTNEDRKNAINPFSWVIRGLCRKNDTECAKGLLLEMIQLGPSPKNAVFNSVINCLSKSGDLENARDILKLMESRGLKPDVYSYTVIMSGYVKRGSMEEACKVFSDAKNNHRKLCPAIFHSLIRGYCKVGKFDKGLNLMNEMKNYGVEVGVDEYNKMIQALCLKALDWETAEKLLEEMRGKGLRISGVTRILVNAVKEL